MIHAYIGLGSNLEQPVQQVHRALEALSQLPDSALTGQSPLYRSRPVGPPGQDWYINAVARLETRLPALELLDQLQAIEARHHRRRIVRWGPRTLDLDLLLYGDQVIRHPRLTVPHAHMTERNFVLQPLLDIWPDAVLPDGTRVRDRLAELGQDGLEPLAGNQI